MRLKLASDDAPATSVRARIRECDPLPPEDRARSTVLDRSLNDLYRAQAPRLLRFFRNRSGADDPLDLVHETFERLVRLGGTCLRGIDKPEAYLSRIAGNLLRDRSKTAMRRFSEAHVPIDEMPLADTDPHAQLEARDMINRLETAMERLRPRTREIYMACRLDGYSYAEVAERTGMSIRGVRKQMSRAIAEIERALSEG